MQEFRPGDYVRVKGDTPVAWGNRDVSGYRGVVRSTAGGIASLDFDRGQGVKKGISSLECLERALPDYPENPELFLRSPSAGISRVWEAMLARREAAAEDAPADTPPDVPDYASMSVSELIEAAHQNARARGFYDDYEAIRDALGNTVGSGHHEALRDMAVAQRLALIATEVNEFEITNEKREELEELADVCIRVFDLVGFLEDDLFDCELLKDSPVGVSFSGKSQLLASLYSSISSATAGHRIHSDDAFFCILGVVIDAASDYAREIYEEDSLRRAIVQKMEKNRHREYKHGARY